MLECEKCYWFKKENPFEKISNDGRFFPCNNIPCSGWRHWQGLREVTISLKDKWEE